MTAIEYRGHIIEVDDETSHLFLDGKPTGYALNYDSDVTERYFLDEIESDTLDRSGSGYYSVADALEIFAMPNE